ncbi:MAG TPA: hypothetical protein VK730_10900 [Solirubrobacteraceae bacterium]|jgi:hypothetical protein|nr:hypothetical protein [Solirubrobacteraceae bacterium]
MALVGAVLALLLVRDSDLRHDEATGIAAEPCMHGSVQIAGTPIRGAAPPSPACRLP